MSQPATAPAPRDKRMTTDDVAAEIGIAVGFEQHIGKIVGDGRIVAAKIERLLIRSLCALQVVLLLVGAALECVKCSLLGIIALCSDRGGQRLTR